MLNIFFLTIPHAYSIAANYPPVPSLRLYSILMHTGIAHHLPISMHGSVSSDGARFHSVIHSFTMGGAMPIFASCCIGRGLEHKSSMQQMLTVSYVMLNRLFAVA